MLCAGRHLRADRSNPPSFQKLDRNVNYPASQILANALTQAINAL
jgi:hypothetical protein